MPPLTSDEQRRAKWAGILQRRTDIVRLRTNHAERARLALFEAVTSRADAIGYAVEVGVPLETIEHITKLSREDIEQTYRDFARDKEQT